MLGHIRGYHIHVYFDAGTKDEALARKVREKAMQDWGLKAIGRFHTKPVGPHVTGSFLIWVDPEQRDFALEWTTANRRGLKAMMHKVTDDDHHDHTEAVTWYGTLGYEILDTSIFENK